MTDYTRSEPKKNSLKKDLTENFSEARCASTKQYQGKKNADREPVSKKDKLNMSNNKTDSIKKDRLKKDLTESFSEARCASSEQYQGKKMLTENLSAKNIRQL